MKMPFGGQRSAACPELTEWVVGRVSNLAIESLPIGQENLTQSRQERQEKLFKNLCAFASLRENPLWFRLVRVRSYHCEPQAKQSPLREGDCFGLRPRNDIFTLRILTQLLRVICQKKPFVLNYVAVPAVLVMLHAS